MRMTFSAFKYKFYTFKKTMIQIKIDPAVDTFFKGLDACCFVRPLRGIRNVENGPEFVLSKSYPNALSIVYQNGGFRKFDLEGG
jgi:hypothetical protein